MRLMGVDEGRHFDKVLHPVTGSKANAESNCQRSYSLVMSVETSTPRTGLYAAISSTVARAPNQWRLRYGDVPLSIKMTL